MASDIFLQLDGITGECSDARHAGWIEISAWGASYEQPISNSKAATGPSVERCKAEPISITKIMDQATPDLLKKIWSGQIIPKGAIHAYRADKEGTPILYLKLEMMHILVTTYSLSGGEGDLPGEELGLSCGYVKYWYDVQKHEGGPTGAKGASCNFITNVIA